VFRVSFMAWVASTCSLSLFSICWNLLSSMAGELTTVRDCKGITQTLIPDTLAVKPKASQSTDGNLLWSVVYISDTVCLCVGAADDTQPALADPHPLRWPWPVTGGYAAGVP
jgi:hypothetical protein